jgi:hypothetical protein
MKYTYSDPHKGLMPWPLMEEPNVHDEKYYYSPGSEFAHFKKGAFYKDEAAYTSWLQETPLCLVRPEDIEWFSVERGEDEFEVRIGYNGGKGGYEEKYSWAIPKKGNEGKEQSPSVEQGYSEKYKGWVAIFKDEKNYCDFLKWQRGGYSEAEVVELLRQQRELCAEAFKKSFMKSGDVFYQHKSIVDAHYPPLKSSLNQKQ